MSKAGESGRRNEDLRAVEAGRRVAILGYGRFGRALAQLALDSGLQTFAWDPLTEVPYTMAAATPAELVTRARLVVLAVPTSKPETPCGLCTRT